MLVSKANFIPRNPDFKTRVHESFSRQSVMGLIGAKLVKVIAGEVEIHLPFRKEGSVKIFV
jgi:hypothetical protein